MRIEIEKSTARGEIYVPSSKSMAHRHLICAAMCEGESRIRNITFSDDVLATIDCLRALGVKITTNDNEATLVGIDFRTACPSSPLPCRESGSTMRFLLPLAWLSGNEAIFSANDALMKRPQGVYSNIAKEHGLTFEMQNGFIRTRGKLNAGEYKLPGNVSSQFISGMMLALSLLYADSKIVITTPLESASYVNMTMAAMRELGVIVEWENDNVIYVRGGQKYNAKELTVEGDFSGAAFIDAFNYLGGNVRLGGLNEDSLQGDRVYSELFRLLDEGNPEISIADCPDLAPILFTLAAMKNGASFTDTRRLRIKESDRAKVMADELSKFGADIHVGENEVIVKGGNLHSPSEMLLSHNDHRVVMSLAVISSVFGGVIDGYEAVKKSYPDFFSDIEKLGIKFKL